MEHALGLHLEAMAKLQDLETRRLCGPVQQLARLEGQQGSMCEVLAALPGAVPLNSPAALQESLNSHLESGGSGMP